MPERYMQVTHEYRDPEGHKDRRRNPYCVLDTESMEVVRFMTQETTNHVVKRLNAGTNSAELSDYPVIVKLGPGHIIVVDGVEYEIK